MIEYNPLTKRTEILKSVDIEAAEYWRNRHYAKISDPTGDGVVLVKRTCDYEVQEIVLNRIVVICHDGRQGIANMHGDVILPCLYNMVKVTTSTYANNIFTIHFLAYMDDGVQIFLYDGEKVSEELNMNFVR